MTTKNSSTRTLIWIGVIAGICLFIYGLLRLASSTDSFGLPPVTARDHVLGSPTSSIVLIEYSDFQCPACGAYYPFIKQLTQEMGNRMALVARNFPLPQHNNAQKAAQTAEAAAKQNKYWEMHDLLFERQNFWQDETDPDQKFLSYAELLGLNTSTFVRDYNSDEIKKTIQTDVDGANSAAVDRTPSFFLNGKRITNLPENYADLKKIVEEADK